MSLIQSGYSIDSKLACLVDYDIHTKKWIIKQEASLNQKKEILNSIASTEDILKKRFCSRYQKVKVIIE